MSSSGAQAPAIFTIFGVTGDLAGRKILPSLWYLYREDRLPERLAVIGFARRPLAEADFKTVVREAAQKTSAERIKDAEFDEFFRLFTYLTGDYSVEEGFAGLRADISRREIEWGQCASKLFYLAVPPTAYESIFTRLAEEKLNLPCDDLTGWTRILIEKPFGDDEKSAAALEELLGRYFKEEQLYRIDHYLFKEIVQGIQNFRFSNNLFESKWGEENIERIDVRLHESLGVESRGAFYDEVGALKDVGQNHLLEMLAAIAMDYPDSMDAAAARHNREAILETIEPWTDESVRANTYRAQYEGYEGIKGVREGSQTETYYALGTSLRHPRWAGVPVYMDSGKRMGEARKEITLTLRHPKHCLLCETGPHGPNTITFRLEPVDEIVVSFWTKKPGFEQVLEERDLSFFLYEKKNKVQYVEEYSKVVHEAIAGDQSLFCSAKEVAALWRFTDPVIDGWRRGLVPLARYAPGTTPHPMLPAERSQSKDTNGKGPIGFIGLGKMGANLARQIQGKGWRVHGYDRAASVTKELEAEGLKGAYGLRELVQSLPVPRTIWLMVVHTAVDAVLGELTPLLSKGDTVIDGGNSPYKESMRRHEKLSALGIDFLDAGVSGGPRGALEGACVMVGGEKELFARYEPLFKDMSVPDGYLYAGKGGAGHFVKMVHNGIEYGMMQAIAEGFTVLERSRFSLDLAAIAKLYNRRSVIESRLVGWLATAYEAMGAELGDDLRASPVVGASGEGEWTVDEARELGIPVPIIEGALEFRKRSANDPSYTGRILSAMRNQFGGHTSP
ncbi:MAG TPA: glucose-6-phosphate dehydrogenase [Candidatus Paceibacterota bacterium]|jgi:glucose-6-phosphate 1-dehydrogenase/6-phosphogluconate dehydrogenase (decarboxylating)|nr:glucose-6-phosphate dehydrogenase [Candidatus Paceibacterota bacterium]